MSDFEMPPSGWVAIATAIWAAAMRFLTGRTGHEIKQLSTKFDTVVHELERQAKELKGIGAWVETVDRRVSRMEGRAEERDRSRRRYPDNGE